MTDMMAIKEKELEVVAGGVENGNLPDSILYKMSMYERYTYQELYRRLNIALEQNNRKEARRYYGEALAWEKQMKYKYHK